MFAKYTSWIYARLTKIRKKVLINTSNITTGPTRNRKRLHYNLFLSFVTSTINFINFTIFDIIYVNILLEFKVRGLISYSFFKINNTQYSVRHLILVRILFKIRHGVCLIKKVIKDYFHMLRLLYKLYLCMQHWYFNYFQYWKRLILLQLCYTKITSKVIERIWKTNRNISTYVWTCYYYLRENLVNFSQSVLFPGTYDLVFKFEKKIV